jgi:hypothetical protein
MMFCEHPLLCLGDGSSRHVLKDCYHVRVLARARAVRHRTTQSVMNSGRFFTFTVGRRYSQIPSSGPNKLHPE